MHPHRRWYCVCQGAVLRMATLRHTLSRHYSRPRTATVRTAASPWGTNGNAPQRRHDTHTPISILVALGSVAVTQAQELWLNCKSQPLNLQKQQLPSLQNRCRRRERSSAPAGKLRQRPGVFQADKFAHPQCGTPPDHGAARLAREPTDLSGGKQQAAVGSVGHGGQR